MEQLQHPFVTVQLTQRCNGAMGEHAVGFFKDFLEISVWNAAGDKRAHDAEGQLVIWQTGPGSDFLLGETWQVFRDVQTAVGGKACQQDVFEIQGRCLAAGTDVAHRGKPSVWSCKLQATSYK
ncbi:hypothetical protein D3C78_1050380 [compost metagenome]